MQKSGQRFQFLGYDLVSRLSSHGLESPFPHRLYPFEEKAEGMHHIFQHSPPAHVEEKHFPEWGFPLRDETHGGEGCSHLSRCFPQ